MRALLQCFLLRSRTWLKPRAFHSRALGVVLLAGTVFSQERNKVVTLKNPSEGGTSEAQVAALLEKQSEERTVDEKMDVFDYVFREGSKEASKAKGKDVVVFLGDSGAGKSTLVNYLVGCTMQETDGRVVVSPDSRIPAVVKVGLDLDSETLLPKCVPDISVPITDLFATSEYSNLQELHLTFFDLPGFDDSRGIEVSIANAIIVNEVIENAKSVRLVFVFDSAIIKARRRFAWQDLLKVLTQRFKIAPKQLESLFYVIATHTHSSVAELQASVNEYTDSKNTNLPNLSHHLTTYDPSLPDDRQRLLAGLVKTKADKLKSRVALSARQIGLACELEEHLQEGIQQHLEKGEDEGALQKIRFTHNLATLGGDNQSLRRPYAGAQATVEKHAEHMIEDIAPSHHLQTQLLAYKKFTSFRAKFQKFANFKRTEKLVQIMLENTEDPRNVAWNEGSASAVSWLSAAACALNGCLCSSVWALPAVVFGGVGSYALVHFFWPTEEEKNLTLFFTARNRTLNVFDRIAKWMHRRTIAFAQEVFFDVQQQPRS